MKAVESGFLRHKRILIVEDEYLIARDLAEALIAAGAHVIGPVGSSDDAEQILRADPQLDLALLNVRLRGGTVFDLADRLDMLGVPFLFVSGYDASSLPERFQTRPRVDKPVQSDVLMERIRAVLV